MGKKKKVMAVKAKATLSKKTSGRTTKGTKEERRAQKLERRKREKRLITADMWAAPAPSHLVAKLDVPRVKSKYQSYFEFADNSEKKEKKLEYKVVSESEGVTAGCVFVPIGNPALTKKCKEISRERGAMIFIVSSAGKEANAKISDHVHRTGYQFRDNIVEEALKYLEAQGQLPSNPIHPPGAIEPIPESQEEINKQADGAIRDLFPRIPHTDRTMIIEHAFKKGTMFHGEPTVGLQANIPLSRRVQLAVLAHIRHTHTRYDKLLRETSWMNARKAVEPVCLDVLVKWRGDEETGRDQMDEILREVVIITDSEDGDESSDDDDSSEEGEVSSISSSDAPTPPISRTQNRSVELSISHCSGNDSSWGLRKEETSPAVATSSRAHLKAPRQDKKAQRGFQRYRAAWENARNRQQGARLLSTPNPASRSNRIEVSQIASSDRTPAMYGLQRHPAPDNSRPQNDFEYHQQEQALHEIKPSNTSRLAPFYTRPSQPSTTFIHREEITVRPCDERPVLYQDLPHRFGIPSHPVWDQGPPQVVSGSPVRHGLQDMLVASIENGSSEIASPRLNERDGVRNNFILPQDPYSRRVMEHRIQSPAARQVIVIDDDNSPVKRRRLIREDEVGYIRPLQSRDQSDQIPVTSSESHLISASSAQQGGFFIQHPRVSSQPTQGLYRDIQPIYTDPTTSERLPIYDEHEVGYFTSQSAYPKRPDGMRHVNRPQYPHETLDESHNRQPGPSHLPNWNESMENIERGNVALSEPAHGNGRSEIRPWSPPFPVSARNISHSNDMRSSSAVQNQNSIHTLSQSRVDGNMSHTRDGFLHDPEGSYQNAIGRSTSYYQRLPTTSYAPLSTARARSPVQFMERPIQYRNESQLARVYEQRPLPVEYLAPYENSAPVMRQQQALPSEGPAWGRPVDPRRQIIVVD